VSAASGASVLSPYNVIVSGTFTDLNNIDVGGGLAAGGLVTISGTSTIGDALLGESELSFPQTTGTNGGGTQFTTGTLIIADSGVTGGYIKPAAYNFYVSGGAYLNYSTYPPTGNIDGTLDTTGGLVSSSGASSLPSLSSTGSTFTQLQSQSTAWSTLNGGATTTGDSITNSGGTGGGGTTTITVTKSGLNVVYVTAADMTNGWLAVNQLEITGLSGSNWLIVDVAGTADGLSGNSMTIDGYGANGDTTTGYADDVVFNFYQMTTTAGGTLSLDGSVLGSILAPGAAMTGCTSGCQVDGQLVAASFAGGSNATEFHNFLDSGGTPEPAPIACVGLGLLALAYIRKRRRA